MKNAGIGLQKVQLLECKMFKYKPLKMDAESAQNVDLKIQKMQVSHCNDCRFWLHLIHIAVIDCIQSMTVINALKLQWETDTVNTCNFYSGNLCSVEEEEVEEVYDNL